jgi:hypothetical protein
MYCDQNGPKYNCRLVYGSWLYSISTKHKIDYRFKCNFFCDSLKYVVAEGQKFCRTGFLANCCTQIRIWASYRSSGLYLYPVSYYSLFVKSWNVSVYWFIMSALHLGLQQSKGIKYNKCFSAHYERNFIISIPFIMTINIFSWNRDQVADKPFKKCSRQKSMN